MIGYGIFFLFRVNKGNGPRNIKKILIMRLDHIGDVLSSTIILAPLRKKFPDASIDFAAASWTHDLLEANPFIDSVIQFDAPWFDGKKQSVRSNVKGFFKLVQAIRDGRYDLAIDMRGDVRHITALYLARVKHRIGYGITGGGFLLTDPVPYEGGVHETEKHVALLAPLGIHPSPARVRIFLSDKHIQNVSVLKERENIVGAYAVLHAIPRNPLKKWKPEGFSALANYLYTNRNLIPVMVGSLEDTEITMRIMSAAAVIIKNLCGKLSLPELGALLGDASLFVGVDSGPAHIAAASGVPTVILFSGINNPRQWAPRGNNVRIVRPAPGKALPSVPFENICRLIEEIPV
jgi:ADP-heptose:LPS heptosyltransferase